MNDWTRGQLGDCGEELAAAFLRSLGFRIRHRNFWTKLGEIDIVCESDEELIFVEVRTRSGSDNVTPVDSIGSNKRLKLRKNALAYLDSTGRDWEMGFRIDAIGVTFTPHGAVIEHYVDAV